MGKYLTVDEQATYIDVYMDGFVFRLLTDTSDYGFRLRNSANSAEIASARFHIMSGSTNYYYRYSTKTAIVKEGGATGSNRVCLWVNFNPNSGSGTITNLDSIDLYLYFYPNGTIIYDGIYNCSGSVTIDNWTTGFGYGSRFTGFTNTSGFIESSGSESATNHADSSVTADYGVTRADEANYMMGSIYSDNGYFLLNRYENYALYVNNATVTDGDRFVFYVNIDHQDRENDGGTFLDWDTDIDGNSVSVGTICEQSADGLRYYCHTAHTAGAGNEPPNTDYWWEYRMTLGDQYKDLVMAVPTTGSEVTDLVIPMDLSSDGFASDGARHLEMSSDEIEYTVDIARVGHVDVIEDPPIETGTVGSSTDHLIEHIKADDNAASSTIVATVGSNGNWETLENVNRNTSNDTVSTDIDRGTGLDTVDTYMIDHATTVYDNAYFKQGTKQIWFTPQFGYDDAADQTIWSLYVDAGDYIQITYDAGNDRYELRVSWGGTLTTLNGSAYTESTTLQQLTFIQASWDSDEDLCQLVINGQVVDNGTNTGTPSASNAAYVFTGADCVTDADGTGQLPADIYIGDSKAIDGMLRNEGAYFTGNGSVDVDHAHSDITFLWTDSDTTPIGTNVTSNGDYTQAGPIGNDGFRNDAAGEYATAVTSGNIAASEGSMSFWFKPNSALGADCTLFYADAAFKVWWDDSDNDVVFTYNTDVLNMTTAFAAGDTLWHHVEIKWKASDSLYIIVDGEVTSLLTGVDAAPTLDTNMYFTADDASGTNRADVIISDVMITDTMGTPQIPVILGSGPIHMPIRGVE